MQEEGVPRIILSKLKIIGMSDQTEIFQQKI